MWVDTHTHTHHGFNNPGVKHARSLIYFPCWLGIACRAKRCRLEGLGQGLAFTLDSLALNMPRAPRIACPIAPHACRLNM